MLLYASASHTARPRHGDWCPSRRPYSIQSFITTADLRAQSSLQCCRTKHLRVGNFKGCPTPRAGWFTRRHAKQGPGTVTGAGREGLTPSIVLSQLQISGPGVVYTGVKRNIYESEIVHAAYHPVQAVVRVGTPRPRDGEWCPSRKAYSIDAFITTAGLRA